MATATSRPPARDTRDTVNPPRGFDQSAMLTSCREWDYIVNFILASYKVHMNFLRYSYEMKSNLFIWNSREVHMNFVWSSNELLVNFIWNEIKFIHMNLHAVRMKFLWTSCRRTNEIDKLYSCNTNEVDMRLINSSHEIHMKFIWIANDSNFMWTSCELHKINMTSAQEVP